MKQINSFERDTQYITGDETKKGQKCCFKSRQTVYTKTQKPRRSEVPVTNRISFNAKILFNNRL